jgi:hypothetical protein
VRLVRRTTWAQPVSRVDAGGIDVLADRKRSGRPAVVDEVAIVVRTVSDDGRPPAHL